MYVLLLLRSIDGDYIESYHGVHWIIKQSILCVLSNYGFSINAKHFIYSHQKNYHEKIDENDNIIEVKQSEHNNTYLYINIRVFSS